MIRQVEPGVLVARPVLEDGVGNHQPIQSPEVHQAHTILVLHCSIIRHSAFKVPHD